jgi:hypothetical protein
LIVVNSDMNSDSHGMAAREHFACHAHSRENARTDQSDDLFRNAISMTATAIGSDQRTRTVGLARNASWPTLEHARGETRP